MVNNQPTVKAVAKLLHDSIGSFDEPTYFQLEILAGNVCELIARLNYPARVEVTELEYMSLAKRVEKLEDKSTTYYDLGTRLTRIENIFDFEYIK